MQSHHPGNCPQMAPILADFKKIPPAGKRLRNDHPRRELFLVPQGHPKIAQPFKAGLTKGTPRIPQGRQKTCPKTQSISPPAFVARGPGSFSPHFKPLPSAEIREISGQNSVFQPIPTYSTPIPPARSVSPCLCGKFFPTKRAAALRLKKFLATVPALTQNYCFDGGNLRFATEPLRIYLR
jgi:hypothetical protein